MPIDDATEHALKGIRDDFELCPRCRCCELEWVHCDNCEDGHAGHDCGEDTCCCLYPEENVVCDVCRGECGWKMCLGRCDKTGCHKREEDGHG